MVIAVHSGGAIPLFSLEQRLHDSMSKFLYKIFEGIICHSVCLSEEGWSKLLIDMFHLVPCTLMCTCCSKSIAVVPLSLLRSILPALLSHLGCHQSDRLDCNTHAASSQAAHPCLLQQLRQKEEDN